MAGPASARGLAAEGRWDDVRVLLDPVDGALPGPEDQELLAVAAAMTGRYERAAAAWEDAHAAWLDRDDLRRAARSAFWLGLGLLQRGLVAPAIGWFQRGVRPLEDGDIDCPERALFGIPQALEALDADPATSLRLFDEVLAGATRFDDDETAALARLGRGRALVALGRTAEGTAMLDEAMAAALSGAVMPIGVGTIYCAVILACRSTFDLRRAREWTTALSAWCDRQQGLVPFAGQCLVHRSEVAQLDGDWSAAWDEITTACEHLSAPGGDPAMGMALYQRAELHRLRGALDAAEADLRACAEFGHPTDPGWALLQLQRGDVAAASAAVRRARAEAQRPDQRARILAAHVEIVLAEGDTAAARDASDELTALAAAVTSPQLQAVAAQSDAALLLAEDRPEDALHQLTVATRSWRELAAPYELARVQLLRAEACDRLGDAATADLERTAAVHTLETIGATADLVRAGVRTAPSDDDRPGGLSPREVEVLRLLATGMTNKELAEQLVISEKTVARHLSNIFTKIDVGSRSAATAWAFTHGVA